MEKRHKTHTHWGLTSSQRRYLCDSFCLSQPLSSSCSVIHSPCASERTFACTPLTHLDRLVTKRITISLHACSTHTHEPETLRSTYMHMASLCWELTCFFLCLHTCKYTISLSLSPLLLYLRVDGLHREYSVTIHRLKGDLKRDYIYTQMHTI